jgi:hypothetical protein
VLVIVALIKIINSSDPPLAAVSTAYPTPPFSHQPIEPASLGPRGRVHLDRRIDFVAICHSKLVHVIVAEIHI